MKRIIKTSGKITLVLGIVSLLWLIADLYLIKTDIVKVFDINQTGYIVALGYIFILMFHFSAFILIILHYRAVRELIVLKTVSLILGTISFFAIGAQKVLYDEIGKEYKFFGWEEIMGEVYALYFSFILNIIFTVCMIFFTIRTLQISGKTEIKVERKDDSIFTVAQYLGIISGAMGVLLTLSLINHQIPSNRFWIYIPFYILSLIPYGLTVTYWLTIIFKEKITGWYDEKQLRDIMKSSLTTIILSIPFLAVLFIFGNKVSFYWFPYYLFMVLTVFSGSTLYYFKK